MGNIFTTQITLGDATATRCWECIAGRWVYVCELDPNLKSLERSLDELNNLKNDVMTRVRTAELQGMKRLDIVQGWISRVDSNINKAGELLAISQQETAKLCLGGCCSRNYVSSYKFGKKVINKSKELNELKLEGNFQDVAILALPEPMVKIPCDPIVGSESMLDNIWSSLMGDEVGIVGLYGVSGVGKTTLLKQINNMICNTTITQMNDGSSFIAMNSTSHFDLVIWVAVSKGTALRKIQDEIGKKIGFSGEGWSGKDFSEKAIDIYNVLGRKKFVLLLDGIWEQVVLTELGVPAPRKPNGSKVVFTTRFEEICSHMGAHRRIKVEPLGLKDSWRLFSEMVGEDTFIAYPDIRCLAEELANECGGMPYKLLKMAHAMACKRTTQEWYDALEFLRSVVPESPEEIIDIVKNLEEDDEEEEAVVLDVNKAETNVFGIPITDKSVAELPCYASGKKITARDRANAAQNRRNADGMDIKAREYISSLKMRFGDGVATVCLFYNATGGTLKFAGHKDWNGHLREGLYPMKVENGQWGVYVYMHDDCLGATGSRAAVVYRGYNGHGDECDWMLAWDNPSGGTRACTKVFTEIRWKNHFPNYWGVIYSLLSSSGRQCRDIWYGCVSSIDCENINGPFLEAILTLDLD